MKVECTWGQGPDVIVSLEGSPLVLRESPDSGKNRFLYGVVTKGDIDLTVDQARKLGLELLDACKRIKVLEDGVPKEEFDEKRDTRNDRSD